MAEVRLEGVGKRFGTLTVLDGIDLQVRAGEFVVCVGPSGCGKSTLLRLLAGLESASSGSIRIDGRDVTELPPGERGLAMVFQSYALYPHMTVERNIAFGLHRLRLPRAELRRRVMDVARTLQLEPLLERLPRDLSGGQRQRVAIGRAIVRQPRAYLFDEPLSNLDATLRTQMRLEIAELHTRLRATMIYVTHDQIEAMTLADRIVVLNAGRIEQVGAPLEIYARPANRFVAGFIGSLRMNFLPVRVQALATDGIIISLADGSQAELPGRSGLRVGDALTLGVRPEHLGQMPVPGALALAGRLRRIEALGEAQIAHLRTAGGEDICARLSESSTTPPGAEARLWVRAEHCHLFDPTGRALPAPADAPAQPTAGGTAR